MYSSIAGTDPDSSGTLVPPYGIGFPMVDPVRNFMFPQGKGRYAARGGEASQGILITQCIDGIDSSVFPADGYGIYRVNGI
jgi:hypothetical protein